MPRMARSTHWSTCEDGDRRHWEADVAEWQQALSKKIVFLQRLGIEMPELAAT